MKIPDLSWRAGLPIAAAALWFGWCITRETKDDPAVRAVLVVTGAAALGLATAWLAGADSPVLPGPGHAAPVPAVPVLRIVPEAA